MNEIEKIRKKLLVMNKKMPNWYFRGVDVATLFAEIDRLSAERDDWKRQWRLMEAAEKMAEKEVERLTEERDGFRNGQEQLQRICDGLQGSIAKYAAERLELKEENRRLKEELTSATCNNLPF